jgi:hypothetical protein
MSKFESALVFCLAGLVTAILISKYRYGTFLPPPMEDEKQSPGKDKDAPRYELDR